jgi:Fic family protein
LIYLQGHDLFPLSESSVRGLHHSLLSYYPAASGDAGGYKTSSNRVISVNHGTGEQQTVLEPAPPGVLTETAMHELMDWYSRSIREYPWPILVATEFVFLFLAIHPFQDGNGRLGRALFLLALMQSDDSRLHQIVHYVSIDRQIERHRSMY